MSECEQICYQQWVDMYNKKDKECFDLQLKLTKLKQENEELKTRNKLTIEAHSQITKKYLEQGKELQQMAMENDDLKQLFNDEYFKGLDKQTVIELAKKSIRVTAYNRELEHALEDIKKLTVIGINASQCNCGLRALADDILQIISEVKNEQL